MSDFLAGVPVGQPLPRLAGSRRRAHRLLTLHPRLRCSALVSLLSVLSLWMSCQAAPTDVFLPLSSSRSGQFIMLRPRPALRGRGVPNLETNRGYVRLDATLLPVSCERIKEELWRELNLGGPWQGRIFLSLYPAGSAADPITLASERFRDGWQYRVELPDVLERSRVVRALVQVLLLEIANRTPSTHAAEVPMWLSEGLTRQVLASSLLDVVLAPPKQGARGLPVNVTMKDERWQNPLTEAHQRLAASPPLNFQQLSWPEADSWTADMAENFGCSAQLFVSQLLALKNGPACLRSMLTELPRYYNWQLAFFDAFAAYFPRTLDLEKWWGLQMVTFTGHDLTQTWPEAESWRKLDECIRSTVQVRIGTNELPLQAEVKLQTILHEWDDARQTAAIQAKMAELKLLQLRLMPQFRPFVDEYCQVLQSYLQTREHPGLVLPLRKAAVRRRAAEEVVQKLDALDARRLQLKPKENETPKLAATAQ